MIADFAPDIGEVLTCGGGRGAAHGEWGWLCGAVDAESAAGETTEDASAGTAEVIAQPCHIDFPYVRLLCLGLLSKPPSV